MLHGYEGDDGRVKKGQKKFYLAQKCEETESRWTHIKVIRSLRI